MENKTIEQGLIESLESLFSDKKKWKKFIEKTQQNTTDILDADRLEFEIVSDGESRGGSWRSPIYDRGLWTWNWPKKHYTADKRLDYIVPKAWISSQDFPIEKTVVSSKNTKTKPYSRIESMVSLDIRAEKMHKARNQMFSNNTVTRLRTLITFLSEDLPRLPHGYRDYIVTQLYDMVDIIAERNKNNMLWIRNPEWKESLQMKNNENIAKLPLEEEIKNLDIIVSDFQEKVDFLSKILEKIEQEIKEAEDMITIKGGNERFDKYFKRIEKNILIFPQKIQEIQHILESFSRLGILNGINTNIEDIEAKIYAFEDSFATFYRQLRGNLHHPKNLFPEE